MVWRAQLAQGALGFVGARAIHEQLQSQLGEACPSVSTIGRVLRAEGLVEGAKRRRRPPPPPGWYLPAVACGEAELDCCDYIEDLRLEDGPLVQVFTVRSLRACLAQARVDVRQSSAKVCQSLLALWRQHGRPRYVQFDNGTVFQGGHNWPDTFGVVTRFCLALGVTPLFAPPAEHGMQNLIESFNGLWQLKVWQRFHHADVQDLQRTSDRFIGAWTARRSRQDGHALRTALPPAGQVDLRQLAAGTVIYLRRCDEQAAVSVLGHRLQLPANWSHRLVRIEVDLTASLIRCFGLRRNDPTNQPLLLQQAYSRPPLSTFHTKLTSIIWH